MTVYVDNMRGDARIERGVRTIRGQWSHLLADDPAELAEFAAGLALRPEWLQAPGTPREHYDIVESVRRRAVATGAVPISYPRGTGNVIATKRLQAAALDAAGRGWHIFPLRPGTKIPAVRHWQHEATTDTEQIKQRWTADLRRRDGWYVPEPDNVGIACGPSGLVVLDLDLAKPGQDLTERSARWRDRDPSSGVDVLAALAEQAGESIQDTYEVITPSGGRHLYFSAPKDLSVRNSAGHLGPMVDVRGQGGYVVAVGSRLHPQPDQDDAPLEAGGPAYRLVHDLPVALLPGWLADATAADRQRDDDTPRDRSPQRVGDRPLNGQSDRYGAAALRGEADRVRSAPVGQRNHTLNAAAFSLGQLVAAGALDQTRTVETLTEAAEAAGLQAAETAATIDSGLTAGARNPRVLQPPQTRTSREGAYADPAVDEQTSGTERHSDDENALEALDRSFDQIAAVAVETATHLVTDATPDQRPALLRDAATRIAQLVDLERIDGHSALDALTAAAGRVGMTEIEVEAAINAGFARSRDAADVDDDRPAPAASGSVPGDLVARREQLQPDAADTARERTSAIAPADDTDREDRSAQPVTASSALAERSEVEHWHYTRHRREQAATFRPRWHRVTPESPKPQAAPAAAHAGSAAGTQETARAEQGAPVTAVAERSAAAQPPDETGLAATDMPGPTASAPEASHEGRGASEVAAAQRSDAITPDEAEDAKLPPGVNSRPEADHHTDTPVKVPAPEQKPPPHGPGSLKAEVAPADASDGTPDPHVLLDQAIGHAQTAVDHLKASRATSRQRFSDQATDAALRNDRPAYWAEPEVDL